MAFAVKRLPQIMSDMISWIVANQDKITDFNEGSVIRSYCEAVGIQLEEFYIKARLGFDKHLLNIPFNIFNFSINPGLYAGTTVVFTRSGSTGLTEIDTGTLISTPQGIRFETTEDGSITDGNTESGSITVQAVELGQDGNVPASTITVIITSINGMTAVTNSIAATGGQNEETKAQFEQRFQEHIEGLGGSNIQGLIAGAKSVTAVRSASIVEHFPPVATYNLTLYIDDGSGNADAQMISDVEEVIIGDGTDAQPGKKGGGIRVRILAPTKVSTDVTATITDDGTLSEVALEYNLELAITNYINNLQIGEDVILNKLRTVMMNEVSVTDVAISVPSSNTSIGTDQIARIGNITLSF